jgi:hypothetical protein
MLKYVKLLGLMPQIHLNSADSTKTYKKNVTSIIFLSLTPTYICLLFLFDGCRYS